MEIVRVESGMYKTNDDKFIIKQDWTSSHGGTVLVKSWNVYLNKWRVKTCKTLAEAKDYVKLQYV